MTNANANGDWVQGMHRACRCRLGKRARAVSEVCSSFLAGGVQTEHARSASRRLDCLGSAACVEQQASGHVIGRTGASYRFEMAYFASFY